MARLNTTRINTNYLVDFEDNSKWMYIYWEYMGDIKAVIFSINTNRTKSDEFKLNSVSVASALFDSNLQKTLLISYIT